MGYSERTPKQPVEQMSSNPSVCPHFLPVASRRRLLACVAALLAGLLHVASVAAQGDDPEARRTEAAEALAEILTTENDATFIDPLDRETPRSSATAFLLAAERGDFERAARYLDFRNLPRSVRELDQAELAEQLYLVITRSMWIDLDGISDEVAGAHADSLPGYRDLLGEVVADGELVKLLLQKVPADEEGQYIWKISNATVAEVPALYELYGYPEWVEWFRAKFPSRASFLGVELFKWAIQLIVVVLIWP
jgi:MscS family membrane protein